MHIHRDCSYSMYAETMCLLFSSVYCGSLMHRKVSMEHSLHGAAFSGVCFFFLSDELVRIAWTQNIVTDIST
jgi:hypothetical protein